MFTLKKTICLILSFIHLSLYGGEVEYIFCIDGGGSKTSFQVIDSKGQLISLIRNGVSHEKIETSGSNLNNVGIEGVRLVLKSLFEDVRIGEENLVDKMSTCQIIAGLSGAANPKNKQTIISLFKEWGLKENQILVLGDAELSLKLFNDKGIVIICGTGSCCFGKKGEETFRVGGLGRVLGDEGSSYQIGIQALKAGLAEECGWGDPTSLTPALKEFFNVSELKNLIQPINLGEISSPTIACLAPLVFQKAYEKDAIANEILNRAASDIGDQLATLLKISHLSDCEVHLVGGVFKNQHAETFIQKIIEQAKGVQKNLKVVNQSHQNIALLFAFKCYTPSTSTLENN